jgi:hypothetical protein
MHPMRISALVPLLVLAACSTPKQEPAVPAGFTKRIVAFNVQPGVVSPIGQITLHVPAKYDTLQAWVDAADTPWANKAKYRFTNSAECLLKESGYKRPGDYCQDTLDRLTIVAQASHASEETMEAVNRRIKHLDERYNPTGTAATVWKLKKLEIINGRTFSVVESFGGTELIAQPYEQLTATTIVQEKSHNWEVTLQFDCKQQDCRSFAKEAYTVLKSVQIDTAAVRR